MFTFLVLNWEIWIKKDQKCYIDREEGAKVFSLEGQGHPFASSLIVSIPKVKGFD